jgi:hypothetical protein
VGIRIESAGQTPQVLDCNTHNLQEHEKDSEMMCKCFPPVFLNLHSHTYIVDVTQAPALNSIVSEAAQDMILLFFFGGAFPTRGWQ